MNQASTRSFAQNLAFELSKDGEESSHRATGWRSQIESLGQRNETNAKILEFLQRRQQIRYRPAPAIQTPDEHDIDFAPTSGLNQSLARLPLRCAGADFTNLYGDGPTTASGILT
jgi:hypothetical protein